ncbi:MAG: VWA domain-containing protein [Bacteroidales bacterium]|jgi:magnesium chelatase subunit D|nr:VWA domain-containing protein [Bacteroidales bacterium]
MEVDNRVKKGDGRRSVALSSEKRGKYVSDRIPDGLSGDIALSATIRAAAPRQKYRKKGEMAVSIEPFDIREKKRMRKVGNTIVFVVDSSGSMGVSRRMKETKAAILSLLIDAYQKRDQVSLVVFKQNSAELILPPTSSVELAKKALEYIPTGGKSPLNHGLLTGFRCIMSELKKHKDCKPLLVLISDGRMNVSIHKDMKPLDEATRIALQIKSKQIDSLVIDTEKSYIRLGKLREIADVMGARYLKIEDLKAGSIINALGKGRI